MKTIIVIFLTLVVGNFEYAFASGFPHEVRQFAEQHNCSEVVGFYDRPGMVEPSFQYGYIQTMNKSESVIFWCQSNKDKKEYELIL